MARHQRTRQAELARGDGEGPGARDAHEALHGAETVHARSDGGGRIVAGSATISCASSGFRAQMSKTRVAPSNHARGAFKPAPARGSALAGFGRDWPAPGDFLP